jgi:hypothetical protein
MSICCDRNQPSLLQSPTIDLSIALKQWPPLRALQRTLSALLTSPPHPSCLARRTLIHVLNLKLFLLASNSPPPSSPTLALSHPDIASPLLPLVRTHHIPALARPCTQANPFSTFRKKVQHQNAKQCAEYSNNRGQERNCRHLTPQPRRPQLKTLRPFSANGLVPQRRKQWECARQGVSR